MWKEHGLINSFTLECSFFGPTKGPLKDTHFTISTLLDLGRHFCETLVEYTLLSEEAHRRILRDLEAQNVLPVASLPEELLIEQEEGEKQAQGRKTAKANTGQQKGAKVPKKGSFMNLRNKQTPFNRKPSVSTPQGSVTTLVPLTAKAGKQLAKPF